MNAYIATAGIAALFAAHVSGASADSPVVQADVETPSCIATSDSDASWSADRRLRVAEACKADGDSYRAAEWLISSMIMIRMKSDLADQINMQSDVLLPQLSYDFDAAREMFDSLSETEGQILIRLLDDLPEDRSLLFLGLRAPNHTEVLDSGDGDTDGWHFYAAAVRAELLPAVFLAMDAQFQATEKRIHDIEESYDSRLPEQMRELSELYELQNARREEAALQTLKQSRSEHFVARKPRSGIFSLTSIENLKLTSGLPNGVELSGDFEFIESTDEIPVIWNTSFGFEYEIAGVPNHARLTIEERAKHPPLINGKGSQITESTRLMELSAFRGIVDSYFGFTFIEGFDFAHGPWRLEILINDAVVLTEEFWVTEQ